MATMASPMYDRATPAAEHDGLFRTSGGVWVPRNVAEKIGDQLLTAQGSMIYASAAGTPAELAKGTSGQVLTMGASVPAWADAASDGGWEPVANFSTGSVATWNTAAAGTLEQDALYRLSGWTLQGTGGSEMHCRVSTATLPTVTPLTTSYASTRFAVLSGFSGTGTSTTSFHEVNGDNRSTSYWGWMELFFFQVTGAYPRCSARSTYVNNSGGEQMHFNSASYRGATTAVTALHFYNSTGNVTFVGTLYKWVQA